MLTWLEALVAAKGSDLHLKVGSPPRMRVDGRLGQRLVRRAGDGGRVAVLEIMVNTGRTAEAIADPEHTGDLTLIMAESGSPRRAGTAYLGGASWTATATSGPDGHRIPPVPRGLTGGARGNMGRVRNSRICGICMTLTVLINAGPWLPVPPPDYGGIENVLATLIPELRARGVEVVLCTVEESTVAVDDRRCAFGEGQFGRLAGPYAQVMGITHAHMATVLETLRSRRDIDLVHDHLEVVGPSVLGAIDGDAPPVLQTLHWDLRKHPEFYGAFDGKGRVFFNAVSNAQLDTAPDNLRNQSLGAVHLGVDLAAHPFRADKGQDYLVLGRVTPFKGQAV
ncbi:MAG TPA: glycosyltransferase, partial [Actinomycetes bacterium]|nr:glycosyltransferase [Actinomycetes bacterium]